MEWDGKVKMIQLGNAMDDSDESKVRFQNYCLEQLPKFDGQAWDMFCNIVEIIPEEMKKDIKFWEMVWGRIKDVDCSDEKFGLRSRMRISLIQVICKEELKLA